MSEPRTVVAAACGVGLALLLASGAAADAVAPVLDRELPDLDRGLPAVLDLDSGGLALAQQPAAFANVEEYKAALARLGDLAYDDVQGGLLFLAAGFALPLGTAKPGEAELLELSERLEPRVFLRGSELAPGSWFAVRTRAGKLSLALVVTRTREAIRLRWSAPRSAQAPVRTAGVDAIAAVPTARLSSALLPPLGEAPESVLRLATGGLVAGPALPEPFLPRELGALVDAVGRKGDLAYFRLRSGMLIVAAGKLAQLGTGPVAALAGRDLRPRLRERSTVASNALIPGSVLLVETTRGQHALVRVDAVEPEGLRVTWLLQSDGSAVFRDLAAFDATFEIADPKVLDRLLLAAAARGDSAALRRLLALGADANATRGRDARPALVLAVIDGDVSAVAVLLEAGADPAGAGSLGWNALQVAAQLGRVELVEALLGAGADPQTRTPEGKDALQLALDSPRQSLALIRLLRRHSETPDSLALAARVGDLAALGALLADGAAVDLPREDGQTALQVAAAAGQPAAVRILLAAGADPGIESEAGDSALLAAVAAGQVETAALLIEHGGVSDAQMNAALYRANENGSPELVGGLLRGGADAGRDQGKGLSPLDHVLQYGSESVVAVYLENGYALSAAAAARLGLVEQLTTLLEQGVAPNEASADGRVPLQHAIENDQIDALRVLLDHGVAADAPLPTWDRRSPLHEAAARADVDVVALLLDRGADANQLDRVGRSPLYDAVAHGREDSVRVLLEHGADPNLAPAGEALIDMTSRESMRTLLASHGAHSSEASPPD
ncbi:MAG: ankyrin repeat domain-containing protein [Myxococcota bacterium]|nr:ankyrin repeat domain-containing protein [Myxococcota bacterium]